MQTSFRIFKLSSFLLACLFFKIYCWRFIPLFRQDSKLTGSEGGSGKIPKSGLELRTPKAQQRYMSAHKAICQQTVQVLPHFFQTVKYLRIILMVCAHQKLI